MNIEERLLSQNKEYIASLSSLDKERLNQLSKGQSPYTLILTCSESTKNTF